MLCIKRINVLMQREKFMRKHPIFKDVLVYCFLFALVVGVITFGISALGGLPEIANHFGFALPGDDGLPFRISYLNRDFISPLTCAGADWCKNGNPSAFVDGASHPLCHSKQDLQKNNEWPLMQVGSVSALPPRPPYPIMASQVDYRHDQGKVVVVYVLRSNDCYVSYDLSGGW
jgi:hypothetical protein